VHRVSILTEQLARFKRVLVVLPADLNLEPSNGDYYHSVLVQLSFLLHATKPNYQHLTEATLFSPQDNLEGF